MTKKLYFFCVLFLSLFTARIFAEETSSHYFDSSRKLLFMGLDENEELIKEISYRLTLEERQSLRNQFTIKTAPYVVKNTFIGFGSGSEQQGDFKGKKIAFTLEMSGLGTVLGTAVLFFAVSSFSESSSSKAPEIMLASGLGTGLAIFLGGRIFSAIRPFYYADNFNTKLDSALLLNENTSLSFMPLVNPASHEYGLIAQLKL